ncbi:neurotransmitter-gated ion-channel ligand binding domain-containing protein [Ditylenchus destructor]|nr:neurotransmitter-gated ion-channel ligand binding domain-containing protein [Ditylenchus destructor]
MLAASTKDEREQDLAKINQNLKILVPKLLEGYDQRVPSHYPIQLFSMLMVDHIEELNELEQTLTFHGTMLLSWEDRRLVWEPKDYGNLDKISLSAFEIARFWVPSVTVKGVTMGRGQIMQYHNSEYTLLKNGKIRAQVQVSLKAACRIDLHSYPNDNQTCFVLVFTPLYSTSKVTFTPTPAFVASDTFFENRPANRTKTAGFILENLNAQRFYAYAKGFTTNESEAQPNSMLTNTVVRFQLLLRRNPCLYFANVSLPFFCCAIMTFMAAVQQNIRISAVWLAVCLVLQIMANDRVIEFLPRDYDSEPFYTKLSKFMLFQTFALLIYRFTMALQYSKKTSDISNLQLIENLVKYALIAEAVIIFWLLFC